jgi:hypothetical protein
MLAIQSTGRVCPPSLAAISGVQWMFAPGTPWRNGVMDRCQWCGLEAVLFRAEVLVRGVRCYVAHLLLCRHCLQEAED